MRSPGLGIGLGTGLGGALQPARSGILSSTFTPFTTDEEVTETFTAAISSTIPGFTSSVAASSFDPSQIAGLSLDLNPAVGVTSVANAVSAWLDQSANAGSFTQATGAKQPTLSTSDVAYNNRPTISFANASSQVLTGPVVSLTQPYTIIVVGNLTSGAGHQQFFGDATIGVTIQAFSSHWDMYSNTVLTGATSDTSKHAFAGVYNGGSSILYIDASGAASASGNAGVGNPTGVFSVGANSSAGANAMNGKVARVLAYSGALSSANIGKLFSYFATYYATGWS